ncbi:Uncharacterized membrane-anchored protein [Verrucomicrobium sp. GAS474]|uniref:GDYXXLXY domain-containing protein n=1 Tax=Verrucomicrobium sp. GAS474 TaxID=1882831 RepID=UPI00087B9C75|nr:GDYXXLXY domain-containing protein [Verrucomicrobium sp. GAS474]SDT96191.1 Uncharacterized membrane-anchored protein [Verrucomicrobium sp. GAS474]
MRSIVLVLIALAMAATGFALVRQKEALLARGTPVLLRLAPVDPRSLMQGDYMALNYEASTAALAQNQGALAENGFLVLAQAGDGTATFVRVDDGTPLAEGEIRLRYRERGFRVRLGAESFFFQEGEGQRYAAARYGELRVAPSGESVLVGLRDEALKPL